MGSTYGILHLSGIVNKLSQDINFSREAQKIIHRPLFLCYSTNGNYIALKAVDTIGNF